MKALLALAICVPLAGCAGQFMEAAAAECVALGISKDSPAYLDCVEAGYERRQARIARIGQGFRDAAATHNAGMPGASATAPMPRIHARFYQGERIDGLVKHCFYRTESGTEIQTVRSVDLCPLS